MRHRYRGRQLSRDTEHRASLRRSLVQSLFEHGKVRTTLPRAKEVKAFAEKLITLARTNSLNNRRRVISLLHDRRLVDKEQEFTGQSVIQKLFTDIAPLFADRPGGYTRIIKLSDYRIGDGGSLVLLQLAAERHSPTAAPRRSSGLRRRRNERRQQFAGKALKRSKPDSPASAPAEPAPAADQAPPAGS